MGKATGFIEFNRLSEQNIPPHERVKNYKEFVLHLSDEEAKIQGARCMDCGIPYCHSGCPVNNQIPDWNDLVYSNDWKNAFNCSNSTKKQISNPAEISEEHFYDCDGGVTITSIIDHNNDHDWPKPYKWGINLLFSPILN